jgi:hypothetical protein
MSYELWVMIESLFPGPYLPTQSIVTEITDQLARRHYGYRGSF